MIEPLEPRIAPASLTFTDVDGDKVTVLISKGQMSDVTLGFTTQGMGKHLDVLDLHSNPVFKGASITITATPQDHDHDGFPEGDGLVNVGEIRGTGIDLGPVTVRGDLSQLEAGDATLTTPGLAKLSATSLGLLPAAAKTVTVQGKLGALMVAGDVVGAQVRAASYGAITIGGSLIGEAATASGTIQVSSAAASGAVKIGGDVRGGGGTISGSLELGQVASVQILGSLIGGTATAAGEIHLGAIGSLKIGGSIVGGNAIDSGLVDLGQAGRVTIGGSVIGGGNVGAGELELNGGAASLTVGGSILGGSGVVSGLLSITRDIGSIKIGGDVKSGGGNFSGNLTVYGKAGSLSIGGSLIGGSATQQQTINSDTIEGQVVVTGDLGAVKIGGSVIGGGGIGSGEIRARGLLASVTIGGSVVGSGGGGSGQIASEDDMGPVKIAGSVTGGAGDYSGAIRSGAKLGNVTLGGTLAGGPGGNSGEVLSTGDLGRVTIAGDVTGSGPSSGLILSGARLAGVTLGGSLLGGPSQSSGEIFSTGDLAFVRIAGSVRGGSLPAAAPSLDSSAYIEGAHIGSVFIGGSIITGTDASDSGDLTHNASIRAVNDLGSITVLGSLIGNGNANDVNSTPVIISARGKASLPLVNDVAIGSITVLGRVELTNIAAGYTTALSPSNADAQVGSVTVSGDWISSNLLVGVQDNGDGFGNSSDSKISGAGVKDLADRGGAGGISKIASVIIKGNAIGHYGTTPDFYTFGIEAQQLGVLRVGGATVVLRPGAGNDLMAPTNFAAGARPLGSSFGTTISDGRDLHAFEVALT